MLSINRLAAPFCLCDTLTHICDIYRRWIFVKSYDTGNAPIVFRNFKKSIVR